MRASYAALGTSDNPLVVSRFVVLPLSPCRSLSKMRFAKRLAKRVRGTQVSASAASAAVGVRLDDPTDALAITKRKGRGVTFCRSAASGADPWLLRVAHVSKEKVRWWLGMARGRCAVLVAAGRPFLFGLCWLLCRVTAG